SVIALIFCLAGILLTFIPPTNSIHSIIYTLAVLAGFGWILVSLNRLLNLWGFTGDKSFSLIAGIIIVPLLLAFSSLLISTWRRANISQT
ncbi:MAG: hypothetical protein KDE20_25080, partial [Caldilineaceae bacterium]|nr:hypothetical protein [Caldilineaceae bacterium]